MVHEYLFQFVDSLKKLTPLEVCANYGFCTSKGAQTEAMPATRKLLAMHDPSLADMDMNGVEDAVTCGVCTAVVSGIQWMISHNETMDAIEDYAKQICNSL